MRPIRKGTSPVNGNFNQYEEAKPDLISRLGRYCSYCERRINTELAVEHIEPKGGMYGKPTLALRWSNFLLACKNCNSCKGSKKVNFKRLLFPDRDNTFHAFEYQPDGKVTYSAVLSPRQKVMARNTLRLTGLDKSIQEYRDENGELVALDRASQRMEAFGTAQVALTLYLSSSGSDDIRQAIEIMAQQAGFFSIWMKVFDAYPDMKIRFIQAFGGTENSGCFDITSACVVTPAPNPDDLDSGGKI